MQVWPEAPKMPARTPSAARSRLASAKTILGDLPPSSRGHRYQVPPGGGRDLPANGRAAGEAHLGHAATDQRPPHLRRAAHDVDDPRRKPGRLKQLAELERRHRGVLGGLDDDTIARSQRRRKLVREQTHRRIPRRDQCHDPQRFAGRVVERIALVERNLASPKLVGVTCEETVMACCKHHLRLRLADNLPVVGALQAAHACSVVVQQIGQLQHQPASLIAIRAAPRALEGVARCGDGSSNILRLGLCHGRPRARGVRIGGIEAAAAPALAPFAADVQAIVRNVARFGRLAVGHDGSPAGSEYITSPWKRRRAVRYTLACSTRP